MQHMKRVSVSMFSVFAVTCAVVASPSDSMLSATQFPKNADDLTFSQRMDLLTDGYKAFDTVFDSNGVCIENCPYVGMTIQEFQNRMDVAAQQVQQDLTELEELELQNPIQGTVSASEDTVATQEFQNRMDVAAQQVQQDLAELSQQNQIQSTSSVYENGAITDNAVLSSAKLTESGNAPVYYTASLYNNSNSNSIRDALRNQNQSNPNLLLGDLRSQLQQLPYGKKIPVTCPLVNNSVRVSSEMGWRAKYRRNHNGMDLAVPTGTPIYAAADGRVVIRKNNPGGYGYYLSIQHDKDYYTVYGHLSQWLVSDGQTVRAGQQIAKSGNTGRSTGPHLHFEVLKGGPLVKGYGGVPINPRTITKCAWNPKNNNSNTGNNRR